MDLTKEILQREEFRRILYYLSNSDMAPLNPADRRMVYMRLEDLYYSDVKNQEYRHFYSDIYSVLIQIHQGDEPGDINVLGQNLVEIRKGYQARNSRNGKPVDISESLKKLYDHVSLDIARINYLDRMGRELRQGDDMDNIVAQLNTITKNTVSLEERNNSIEETVKNSQKEYITILGIFASIVLAFTSGIAFSTSVLQNLHLSSPYRVVMAILLIGFVFTNMMFALLYYIDRIARKSDEPKIRPIIITNVVIVALLILTVVAWWLGVVELRGTIF